MIKRLEKDKQYKIIEVSNIKSNQKIQSTVMCVFSISGLSNDNVVKYKEYGGSELCVK